LKTHTKQTQDLDDYFGISDEFYSVILVFLSFIRTFFGFGFSSCMILMQPLVNYTKQNKKKETKPNQTCK